MLEPTTYINKKLSHTIVTLYVLTLLIVGIGTAFALHQNWTIRLEASKSNLMRSANMGNLLVETILQSADKTLHITQVQLESTQHKSLVSHADIHQLLKTSIHKFETYNATDEFGLLFYVDASGLVYARSDVLLTRPIDMVDRFYFTDLRDHPDKKSTVGPLLKARTTGQWVFHMAVPIHDTQGQFAGVLVQQILANDIADDLAKYTDTQTFEQMLTHYPNSPVSFVYPSPTDEASKARLASDIEHLISPATRLDGASTWIGTDNSNAEPLLIGFSQSPLLGLTTYAALPMHRVSNQFIKDNFFLFAYVLAGCTFITAIFAYLYCLSIQLRTAQVSSMHDALTHLHNRRALDEQLPLLLRDSLRDQTPVTVMFIDIDHFRVFNERFGHDSGDVALKAVAAALASVCQRPLDFICRWGGEEFVAVLPNTNAAAAHKLAQDMLKATRAMQLSVPHGIAPRLTVSVGHITHTMTRDSLDDDLVGAADQAMLHAKQKGRDQSVMAPPSVLQQDKRMTCTGTHTP
jgi:diguanylate cyclase (GGDEF)-like protein